MAMIYTTDNDWVTVGPLAADEIWQCRGGSFLLSLEAVADVLQGLLLSQIGDNVRVPSGKTVRYRSYYKAIISREVIG